MATLQAIRLPDIDPPKLERPNVKLPEVGDAIADAAEAVGLRRSRRSPWPFALAGLMVAGATWLLMKNQGLRARLVELTRAAREGITSWQRSAFGQASFAESEPVAFTAAETKAIPADRWTESDHQTPDYPDGLGSDAPSRPEERALGV